MKYSVKTTLLYYMASFKKQKTEQKRNLPPHLQILHLSWKCLGLSQLSQDSCLAQGMGVHSWQMGTPSLRDEEVTFFINEKHALCLQKCSSADNTKPLSYTGQHLTQWGICPINSTCLFFFFYFLQNKFRKPYNCLYSLIRSQWMLHAVEILVETLKGQFSKTCYSKAEK